MNQFPSHHTNFHQELKPLSTLADRSFSVGGGEGFGVRSNAKFGVRSTAKFVTLLLTLPLLLSCSKQKTIEPDLKHDYYPLAVGHSVEYDVDSIIYNPLFSGGKDTFRWVVREEITAMDTDLAGRTIYIFERTQRKPVETEFRLPVVGSRLIDGSRAELSFQNLRFVPLTFPPVVGKSWDGNAYISNTDSLRFYHGWNYRYIVVDTPATVNGVNFDATLVVMEVEDENLLEYRFSQSRYARGVGLVERVQYNLWFVGSSIPQLPWEQKANNGFIVRWKVR